MAEQHHEDIKGSAGSIIIDKPMAFIRFKGENRWKLIYNSDECRGILSDMVVMCNRNCNKYDESIIRECLIGPKSRTDDIHIIKL